MRLIYFFCCVAISQIVFSQEFYFGNDLSYVNQMEDCGAVFKENMQPKDVYQIFADRGNNLVRVRLWVDPTWQNSLVQPDGVKSQYSDFEDVKETIQRSKGAGMQVLLDFHFSDFWADPGRQLIPERWINEAENLEALKDSVYNYVVKVLTDLEKDTLMPEMVQIGNETNSGLLYHTSVNSNYDPTGSVNADWSRHAALFNAGIRAVRDVSDTTIIKPKIALHCAGLSSASWWFNNIINYGVSDFDIMGLSYYYTWHDSSIKGLGDKIRSLKSNHPDYDVMVLETGYLWTRKNHDGMGNIINTADPNYLPVIPEKQLEYLVDYTREVMRAGGTGVIFWESAWVSTPCRTPWGVGSSHDHVVFFDPENTNFMENGGGRWMERHFYEDLEAKKIIFKVDMTDQDVSNGVYITGSWTGENWQILPMADEKDTTFSYFTYLSTGDTIAYYFLNDNDWEARETVPAECALMWNTDRKIIIPENDTIVALIWNSCNSIGSNDTNIEKISLENNIEKSIEIFPNPSNGIINVQLNSFNKEIILEIIDSSGKLVDIYKFDQKKKLATIDMSYLSSDLYVLKFTDHKNIIYKKLVLNTF